MLDNKPFHPYPSQVKIVLACCILHNCILGYGIDNLVPGDDFTGPASQATAIGSQQPTTQEVRSWGAQRVTGPQLCGRTRDLLGCSLLCKLVSVRNHGVTVMLLCLELLRHLEFG
jgi:hypothetical protein